MGDKVLTYKDHVLRTSDLDVLEGPCFLNDQVIGFYFSYLSSLSCQDDVAFVPPSVSFWLANCDVDSRKDAVEPLKLPSKRLVFFTVNDSDDLDGGESGTHWSTLIYDRSKNIFLHLDSMQGMNHDHAFKLFDSVKEYMGKSHVPVQPILKGGKKQQKKKDATEPAIKTANMEPLFEEFDVPQQTNGYDCGIYVLAIAKAICEFNLSGKNDNQADWLSFVQKHVDTSIEMTLRNEIMLLIEVLRKRNN
ncbi:hypothetical protein OROGR_000477 [Orobanche gracilis]